ncbi:MAG: MFS family permease [Parasphingorhabdus sp.]|jgi:MFS family permease
MPISRLHFLYLNTGHFFDHLFMLIFASVAALRLTTEWNMSYAELIPYATPGFIAFGVCALPAGWLADRWSREGMMCIFFLGAGISSILVTLATTPLEIAFYLSLIGVFAAIYHPVGLAMVIRGRDKTGMPLAINGVFGNLGVACAALLTGYLVDNIGWQSAFVLPGIASIALGISYIFVARADLKNISQQTANSTTNKPENSATISRSLLIRIFSIIIFSTALGGLIFQSTTFALPKILSEQLISITDSATMIGWYAFIVFSLAALAQLVVGYFVDNHSIRQVFIIVALIQALAFATMINVTGIFALLVAVVFMLAVFGQIPINDVLIGRIAKSGWRSRAFAARYIVTFSVMASTIPFIAWIHGNWGFSKLFTVLAIAAALILFAVYLLPRQLNTAKT